MTHRSPFTPRIRPRVRWMLTIALSLTCLAWPATSRAQDQPGRPEKTERTEKIERVEKQAAGPAKTSAPERGESQKEVNVKVDVTITDQVGGSKPIVKTLSAIVAHRQNAQIRTIVQLPVATPSQVMADPNAPTSWKIEELPLDVDLFAEVMSATRTRIGLSLKYRNVMKASEGADAKPGWTAGITQQFSVFLESGKPLVISQSADAATDRKVTIELKATILN